MKPKIEKVQHEDIDLLDTCSVLYNYPSGKLMQVSYSSSAIARMKTGYEVGIWKIKTLKNKYHAN